jgi:RNA polymerase sigma factor (sigma-70 family)
VSASPLDCVVRHLRRAYAPVADAGLLRRFADDRDPQAFDELMRRHGPLVWGACRRALGDRHAAEDAFQTTFLELARQARSLRFPAALPAWLYGVAVRTARHARARQARRRQAESRAAVHPPADPLAEITGRELVAVIDEELARLPERYRLPLVLCAVEGQSREEAARGLGWTTGMVKGRLERGREVLRKRLEARGLTLPVVLTGVLAVDTTVPRELVAATSKAALVALTAPAAWVSLKALTMVAVVLVAGVGSTTVLSLTSREH